MYRIPIGTKCGVVHVNSTEVKILESKKRIYIRDETMKKAKYYDRGSTPILEIHLSPIDGSIHKRIKMLRVSRWDVTHYTSPWDNGGRFQALKDIEEALPDWMKGEPMKVVDK